MTITLTQIEQVVKHWATFVKSHERILVIGLSAALLFHFGEKGLALWDKHEERNATIAQQKVNADEQATKKQDAITASLQAQLDQVKITADAAIKAAYQKSEDAKKVNDQASLTQLASMWGGKLGYPPNQVDVVATRDISAGIDTSDTITVRSKAAHETVNKLEDLDAELAVNEQLNKELFATNKLSAQQTINMNAWKIKFTDEHTARNKDADVFKGKIRKAYFKGLKHGLIIGVPVGVALTVAAIVH